MSEEQLYEENYRKGFNEGYLITQHLPDLSDELVKVTPKTPRIEGFGDGRKQCTLDQLRDRQRTWEKDKHQSPLKGRDIGKDREPDR